MCGNPNRGPLKFEEFAELWGNSELRKPFARFLFEDRWSDRWCVDISMELVDAIEESWAREDSIPPYHIYVKMAYHLSQEAREGLAQFAIPPEFGKLFEFQRAAVRIAAHHLNKRNGVLIGDGVGLGTTPKASAV